MINYLYILISILLTSGTFCITKKYQLKAGTARTAISFFSFAGSLMTFLIFFAWNGFRPEFSMFSMFIAACAVLCGQAYTFIGFRLMECGSYSMYTTYLMTGGMVLPFIFGIIFLNETISILKLIGIIILTLAVILLHDHKADEQKNKKNIRYLMYAAVFFLNGGVSIFSKLHQSTDVTGKLTTVPYAALSAIVTTIICGIWFFTECKLAEKKINAEPNVDAKKLAKTLPWIALYSAIGGVSSFLQLYSATIVDASILYPLITGGTMVMSTVTARFIFGEKQSKRNTILICICFAAMLFFIEFK